MNKRLIALSLVVTLFAAQKTTGNLKPKCLREYFDQNSTGNLSQECQKKIIKILEDKFGTSYNTQFSNIVATASKKISSSHKELFINNTPENLLAAMYEISGIQGYPVETEVVLTDNGYFKHYYLPAKAPNREPFHIAPTKAPWGSWLGLGYVNKQSRGRYWRNKAIGAAVATGAAIGGYYGIKHAGGFENKEQVYEGAKKFANDFYEKGKGWVAGFFTKREEQNIHDINQKIEKNENKIDENNSKIANTEQQKENVLQDPNLSDTTKDKKVKLFDQKIDNLVKENNKLDKEADESKETLSKIYDRALDRKEKNKTLVSEETVTPSTTRVPGETRLGRKTEKVTTQKAPQTLYKNKEELFDSQENLKIRETKQVKRLHKRSAQMEDMGGYSDNVKVGRGIKAAHKKYKAQRDQRAQQKKEEYNKRIKSYRPYKNLEEYQDRLRQREADQRMTPWYKRLFNNDQE